MPHYTISDVITGPQLPPRQWNSNQGGPMLAHKVIFSQHPGQPVEWSRKLSSDAPMVGQQVEGTIDWQNQYGPRFKQESTGGPSGASGGGGGGRQSHPVDAARMGRCHAQDMALIVVRFAAESNLAVPKSGDELRASIKAWADWFEADVESKVPTASAQQSSYGQLPVRNDIQRTGQSDIPNTGTQGFTHAAPAPDGSDHPFNDPVVGASGVPTDQIQY